MITTKEKEREALNKIRKIIDGLGKSSYIGVAFDRCLELAKRNIDEDAAYSCANYIFDNDNLRQQVKILEEANKSIKEKCVYWMKKFPSSEEASMIRHCES